MDCKSVLKHGFISSGECLGSNHPLNGETAVFVDGHTIECNRSDDSSSHRGGLLLYYLSRGHHEGLKDSSICQDPSLSLKTGKRLSCFFGGFLDIYCPKLVGGNGQFKPPIRNYLDDSFFQWSDDFCWLLFGW